MASEELQNLREELEITKKELLDLKESYGRFVPNRLLELIGKDNILDVKLGDQVERSMTVLFSDIRSFTALSETMTPQENFDFINSYLSTMEPVLSSHNGIIDKYIGDAIMALFTSADEAIIGSVAMLKELNSYNEKQKKLGNEAVSIGIGLNTGILMLGTVGGENRMDETVISDTVNLSSRFEGLTKNYGAPLLISEYTLYSLEDASKYNIRFLDRVRVKGKIQPQSVYEVFDGDEEDIKEGKIKTLKTFEKAMAYYHLKEIKKARELLIEVLKINPNDKPADVYLARCDNFIQTGEHESTGELDLETKWDDSLSMPAAIIDEQHKGLLVKINELSKLTHSQNDTSAQIDEIMKFLEEYAAVHFQTEENIMVDNEYPFIDQHRKEHATFIKYFLHLKEILQDKSEDRIYLTFRIQLFLGDWIINHTAKTDRHLGNYLRRRGVNI